MINDAGHLDRLLFNCDYIDKFCRNNVCEANERLRVDCVDRLVQSGRFIYQVSNEFCFEQAPQNGFIQFLKIATIFTDQTVNQIKSKNRIDSVTRKLFESIIFYADWLSTTYRKLKDEFANRSCGSNCQHFVKRELELRSRHFYELTK